MTKDIKKRVNEETKAVTFDTKIKVVAALETPDNQIDFNFIELKPNANINSGSKYTFQFTQYREVIPRLKKGYVGKIDPIVKFDAVFVNQGKKCVMAAVTKLQSGSIDLYWAGSKV